VERRAFAVFANQVAGAVEIAQLQERRQEMVDALVDLRADLDRSEQRRLINEERAQAAERVERAHEIAVAALVAVSDHARFRPDLTDFYRGLTTSIAELVGANKVLFWQLNQDGTLTPIPGAHGVDEAFMARLYPAPCSPDNDDLTSNIVFRDQSFRASRRDESHAYVLDALGVSDAISVAWRAGQQRLGLVAAYDSSRPQGFSREDTWVLQKVGLAAGLVWQLKHAESGAQERLSHGCRRWMPLEQLLLKNVSTAVDKARRRLASDLHDDALQKLTAAELRLQTLFDSDGKIAERLGEIQPLLGSNRRRPPPAAFRGSPAGARAARRLRGDAPRPRGNASRDHGIEAELEFELPDELPYEFKSMVFRQVAKPSPTSRRHAAATSVKVSVKSVDGAIHGLVLDNGRGFVVSERDHLPGHLGLLALNERSLLCRRWTKIERRAGPRHEGRVLDADVLSSEKRAVS